MRFMEAKPQSLTPIIATIGGISGTVIATFAVLLGLGILPAEGFLGAVSGIFVAVITSIVSIVTLTMRNQQMERDAKRRRQQQEIEENRLHREATLDAIKYLGTDSSPKQKDAALMTMCKLGDSSIALAIAKGLASSAEASARLIIIALDSDDPTKIRAGQSYLENCVKDFQLTELWNFANLFTSWPPKWRDSDARWDFLVNFFIGLAAQHNKPSQPTLRQWLQFAATVLQSPTTEDEKNFAETDHWPEH